MPLVATYTTRIGLVSYGHSFHFLEEGLTLFKLIFEQSSNVLTILESRTRRENNS